MARRSRENPEVREYILRNVLANPNSIALATAEKFDLSRTAITGYLNRLQEDGLIRAIGERRVRKYELRNVSASNFQIQLSLGLAEDHIWRFRILPLLVGVDKNIIDICHYGFTEILNNAIDHSGSETCLISYTQNYCEIEMMIVDSGIGIFQKIQQTFDLDDHRSALLELSKGKITTDKTRHSGEGIFFSSRMFDSFAIRSGDLFYLRRRKDGAEWLIESGDLPEAAPGTSVHMTISTAANWSLREVFDLYQGDKVGFRKTHVPISLGGYPGEALVSRSQAKRILTRFDQFSEVLLDFSDVPEIGQAFADEIFRVFPNEHPGISLFAINVSLAVQGMIDFVSKSESSEKQLELLD